MYFRGVRWLISSVNGTGFLGSQTLQMQNFFVPDEITYFLADKILFGIFGGQAS
jgi:hypothetical protein